MLLRVFAFNLIIVTTVHAGWEDAAREAASQWAANANVECVAAVEQMQKELSSDERETYRLGLNENLRHERVATFASQIGAANEIDIESYLVRFDRAWTFFKKQRELSVIAFSQREFFEENALTSIELAYLAFRMAETYQVAFKTSAEVSSVLDKIAGTLSKLINEELRPMDAVGEMAQLDVLAEDLREQGALRREDVGGRIQNFSAFHRPDLIQLLGIVSAWIKEAFLKENDLQNKAPRFFYGFIKSLSIIRTTDETGFRFEFAEDVDRGVRVFDRGPGQYREQGEGHWFEMFENYWGANLEFVADEIKALNDELSPAKSMSNLDYALDFGMSEAAEESPSSEDGVEELRPWEKLMQQWDEEAVSGSDI